MLQFATCCYENSPLPTNLEDESETDKLSVDDESGKLDGGEFSAVSTPERGQSSPPTDSGTCSKTNGQKFSRATCGYCNESFTVETSIDYNCSANRDTFKWEVYFNGQKLCSKCRLNIPSLMFQGDLDESRYRDMLFGNLREGESGEPDLAEVKLMEFDGKKVGLSVYCADPARDERRLRTSGRSK